ncbi:hypothetical protein B0H16DRAFT_1475559 [Mycena metata]|uniref:Uncharacterized protein n=1 Tax=Mycena metata TaxID=1033252 RepID=A0AAD7MIV1_9AGAR|nr:hypothetical protein B0H16DRAFT_1475559 [Mycena metata]
MTFGNSSIGVFPVSDGDKKWEVAKSGNLAVWWIWSIATARPSQTPIPPDTEHFADVEIIWFLQSALRNHVFGATQWGLTTSSCLRVIQDGVEKLISRTGILGRLRELLAVLNTRNQIERYRIRINELRSNFLLVAAIDTNLHVTETHNTIATHQRPHYVVDQFRNIALGDINLLNGTAVNKRSKTKVFTARVFGEPSLMTVVEYEDEASQCVATLRDISKPWTRRFDDLPRWCAATTHAGNQALIASAEVIPLSTYREFRRPSSDLVWVCIEAMLGCTQYHYWGVDKDEKGQRAAICVKPDPPRLCLTMPEMEPDNDIPKYYRQLSEWHFFPDHEIPVITSALLTRQVYPASSSAFPQNLHWTDFRATLVPLRLKGLISREMQAKLCLGSIVTEAFNAFTEGFTPVGYVPNSCAFEIHEWLMLYPSGKVAQVAQGALGKRQVEIKSFRRNDLLIHRRFTFPAGSFRASQGLDDKPLIAMAIQLANTGKVDVHSTWLAQANKCIGRAITEGSTRYRYGVVNNLGCAIFPQNDDEFSSPSILRPEGIAQEVHIFPCSVAAKREGSHIGLEFPEADQLYWSLDPLGKIPLTQKESDTLGLPRLCFRFFTAVNFWHDYQYSALCAFWRARGLNPYTNDIAEFLGSALIEVE